jgi:hypothetical protein
METFTGNKMTNKKQNKIEVTIAYCHNMEKYVARDMAHLQKRADNENLPINIVDLQKFEGNKLERIMQSDIILSNGCRNNEFSQFSGNGGIAFYGNGIHCDSTSNPDKVISAIRTIKFYKEKK